MLPRSNHPRPGPPSSVEGFRRRPQQPVLHPLEKWVLACVTVHLCFLPWALGTMHLWSQCVSLGLALVGFLVAARPRLYETHQTSGDAAFARPLRRLWSFPFFWVGLVVFLYIVIQGLNPAWRYRSNASYWWMEPVAHLGWLPSGMEVPFAQAGPWRALIVYVSLWLTLCTVWMGFLRRMTFRLLFTFLVVNGVLLALLGLAQQLTDATRAFWLVPVSTPTTFVASFIYRNHAGAYLNLMLALGTGLACWYAARSSRRMDKSSPAGVFIFAAIIIGLMVFFSFSRGAVIIMLVFGLLAGACFAWTLFRQRAQERSRVVVVSLVLLLAGFIGIGLVSLKVEKVWQRFDRMLVAADTSWNNRVEARAAATDMLAAKPLFGWGAGCFRFGYPIYVSRYPKIYYVGIEQRSFWEHAHNDILEYPIELGAVGSVLLAAPFGWLGWRLLRRRFWANPLALLAVLGCGLTVVHSWGEFVFQNPAILITWAIVLVAALRWAELDQQGFAGRETERG